MNSHKPKEPAHIAAVLQDGKLQCSGKWTVFHLDKIEPILADPVLPDNSTITFDMHGVTALDSAGAWLLYRSAHRLRQNGHTVNIDRLAPEAKNLYDYITSRELIPGQRPEAEQASLLENIGRVDIAKLKENVALLSFLGETASALIYLLRSPARIRWQMLLRELGEAGYKALPIIGLLTFLLGVVIAYQGAVQLRQYGANIFIADLVGLAMVRELSPLIAAILVAGRTGSAYTAQIGTMKVTEEIDALRTMAITPMELLVLPKLLALFLALPLLTVYADITGILGGMVMSGAMLGISAMTFIDRLGEAISLNSYLIGIGKAPVFAVIIAMVGCFQGFQVSSSAESVGRHTTMSVVKSIFLIILVDAIFSIAFSYLDI